MVMDLHLHRLTIANQFDLISEPYVENTYQIIADPGILELKTQFQSRFSWISRSSYCALFNLNFGLLRPLVFQEECFTKIEELKSEIKDIKDLLRRVLD